MFGRDLNLNSELNADIRYFGSPDEDGSVRIRRDEDDYLQFERRVDGNWEHKFSVTDSVTVDTMKFLPVDGEPTINENEFGLFSKTFKDGDNNDADIVRPVFLDPDGNHWLIVASDEDGEMRVAKNFKDALDDPDGTPLQYKKVKLQGDEIAFIQNVADGPDDPTPTEQVVLWYNDSFTIRGDYSQQTYRIVVVPNEASMRYSMVNDGSSGVFRGGASVNTEISVVVGLIDIDSYQFRKFDFLASEIGGRTGVLRLTGHIHVNDSDEVAVAIQVNATD